jgi:peptidyl-prolyl cis-trans isomerase C
MQRKQERLFWALVTCIILAWIATPATGGETQTSHNKVAVVNGTVITQEDLDKEMKQFQQQLLSRGRSPSDSELVGIKNEVLENLINLELLYQGAQKNGSILDEADINKQLEEIKKQFSNEAEFGGVLAKMNISEADLRSKLKKNMAIQQFIDTRFAQKVTISGEEAKSYYDSHLDSFKQPEEVKASHILIKIDSQDKESQKAEALEKLKEVQKKLNKGDDFAALAKEFSQGPSSARGGDLGYFRRGQMVKPFEEAAFALRPGEVSDIVETRFGYHLIKVFDKKPETTMAFKDIKEKLQQYLKQGKVRKQVSAYVEELKGKARVERLLARTP